MVSSCQGMDDLESALKSLEVKMVGDSNSTDMLVRDTVLFTNRTAKKGDGKVELQRCRPIHISKNWIYFHRKT